MSFDDILLVCLQQTNDAVLIESMANDKRRITIPEGNFNINGMSDDDCEINFRFNKTNIFY